MPGIFLSYRREDAGGHAGRLYDELQAHFGAQNVFRDIDTLLPGADFVDHIEEAIGAADVVVALIGRDWVSATGATGQRRLDESEDYVRLELEAALGRGIPLIPVLVRNATMPRRQELPDALAPLTRRHAFELPDQHWPFAVKALLAALERYVSPKADGTPEDERRGDERERSRMHSFLTSAPALLGALATLVTAITGLIIVFRPDDDGPGPAPPPSPPPAAADTQGPGTDTTPTGAAAYFTRTEEPPLGEGKVYFRGETMYLEAPGKKGVGVKSDLNTPSDVSMSVRVRRDSGARKYGAGLICRYVDRRTYYLLAVLDGSSYNIVKYDASKSPKPMTLERRPLPGVVAGHDFEMGADCEGDDPTRLTFKVNGQTVAERSDHDGIESGTVGIRAGTSEAEGVTIRFDDFVVEPLSP